MTYLKGSRVGIVGQFLSPLTPTGIRLLLLGITAGSLSTPICMAASDLTPSEARGRIIYRSGTRPTGETIEVLIDGGARMDGSQAPCGSCHGSDGRGRPEGAVIPPDIRWPGLTRPYDVTSPTGRRHPAYNERLLIRAVTLGIDSAGNRLDVTMPRFALTQSDAVDLVAYLKKIADDHDPGMTDKQLRIGVLLPPENRFPGLASAVRPALTAYFAEVNRHGGVYERSIDLRFQEFPPVTDRPEVALAEFLHGEAPFALLSSFVAGVEKQVSKLLESERIPLIGARTMLPQVVAEGSSAVFYLDSGIAGQAEALADYAIRKYGAERRPALVSGSTELAQVPAAALRAKLAGTRWAEPLEFAAPTDSPAAEALVRRLIAARVNCAFLFLQEQELSTVLDVATRLGWNSALFIPGGLSLPRGNELRAFPGRIFLALPFVASDASAEARAEYGTLSIEHHLSPEHLATQFASLAEAKILVEALKRAGRDLTRDRLVEAMEGLYDFGPGFVRSVSFGPGRHAGITEFHIVTIDHATGALVKSD
jgi:ABC-type branched-subunit amino acid transport system substrate-binding protein